MTFTRTRLSPVANAGFSSLPRFLRRLAAAATSLSGASAQIVPLSPHLRRDAGFDDGHTAEFPGRAAAQSDFERSLLRLP